MPILELGHDPLRSPLLDQGRLHPFVVLDGVVAETGSAALFDDPQ